MAKPIPADRDECRHEEQHHRRSILFLAGLGVAVMRFPFNFRDWNCLLVSKATTGSSRAAWLAGPDTEDDTTRRLSRPRRRTVIDLKTKPQPAYMPMPS